MMHIAAWFSPELLRSLGLALLHFLWQGAALAALAALGMALTKSASARYALGVACLIGMVVAPVVTFVVLQRTSFDGDGTAAFVNAPQTIHMQWAGQGHAKPQRAPVPEPMAETSLVWLVEGWFLGVLLFSMRTAGGVLLLERLRQQEATVVSGRLLQLCLDLQERMHLHRMVRYCESIHLDAPAVIGWLRPVVLLPFSALTGLSESQLKAVIAHELAHIKRYDAFVNLFQVAAESVLFYHPAVWWLNKRIRMERENCCDDAAIAVCGSPLEYARALTLMEEWRAAPSLAMAANHGPLASRVRRLLGAPAIASEMRTARLAAGVLCLSVAVAAGNAFFGVARTAAAPQSSASDRVQREKDVASAIVVRPNDLTRDAQSSKAASPEPTTPAPPALPTSAPQPAPAPQAAPQQSGPTAPQPNAKPEAHESYIEGMKSVGLGDASVDQLIAMKVQGITPAYVRSMQAEGLKLDVDGLIGMKVQGITAAYIHQMKELGLKTDTDNLIGMKVQGVTPEYVREMRATGIKTDANDVLGMKVQGITPDYIKEIQALGLHPDAGELIGMKVQGITPEYVKALQASGLKFAIGALIGAKVQGVTPQFIEQARSHGFKNLTLEKLIELKVAGVLE